MKILHLVLGACLLLWSSQALSEETTPGREKMIRFVCQVYSDFKDRLYDQVIVVDQLSARNLRYVPEDQFEPEKITAEMLIDTKRVDLGGDVKARLRFFANTSLFNYVSDGNIDIRQRRMDLTKKRNFDRRPAKLLKTPISTRDELGRIMDYAGTIGRSVGTKTATFLHGHPGKAENQRTVDILLPYNEAILRTHGGGRGDGYYFCDEPFFVNEETD